MDYGWEYDFGYGLYSCETEEDCGDNEACGIFSVVGDPNHVDWDADAQADADLWWP